MVVTDRVRALFADARTLQADALEMLAQGRVRNAAEKAWGATSGRRTPWCWPAEARNLPRQITPPVG